MNKERSEELLEKNRKYFPKSEINELYSYQKKVINNLLLGNNTLSIVPTGGGKSLIYQLCSLEFSGITLVVSPLLALMQEQVTQLKNKGINVISINSDKGFEAQRETLRNLNNIKPKLIYISPERLQNYFFRASLINCGLEISMIAIDEAHCISQWGIDFRPEYAQIKSFIDFLKSNKQNPTIYTLTATLSKKPRKDITTEFNIKNDSVIIDSTVIRENLFLNFTKVNKEENKIGELIKFLKENKLKKSIVYLYDRSKCEELSKHESLSKEFQELGFKADFFHADLDFTEKVAKYNAFNIGKINILFATTAFGMGMNIPDVDSIIHYHIPNSVEEFYQHVGRAARKKEICPIGKCLVLWSDENLKVRKRRINSNRYSIKKINEAFKVLDLYNRKNKLCQIDYQAYKGSNLNLPLLKFLFEKYNVLEFVGEINGTPHTIRMKRNSNYWENIVNNSDEYLDSFIVASEDLKIDIREIMKYINSQDLKGEIEYMPAMDRKIYYFSKYDFLPSEIVTEIKNETDKNIDFKLKQFDEFISLLKYKEQNTIKKYIANILGVKFSKKN